MWLEHLYWLYDQPLAIETTVELCRYWLGVIHLLRTSIGTKVKTKNFGGVSAKFLLVTIFFRFVRQNGFVESCLDPDKILGELMQSSTHLSGASKAQNLGSIVFASLIQQRVAQAHQKFCSNFEESPI